MNAISPAAGRKAGRWGALALLREGAWYRLKADATPYLLLLPGALVILAVFGYPMATLVGLSLQHYGLRQLIAHQGDFIGLKNYTDILGDRFFWVVVLRTAAFTAVNVGLTIVAALGIALLMERVHRPIRWALSSVLVLVWATPALVAVDIWQWMFDFEFGVINWLLTHLGFGNFIHHNWFAQPLQGFTVITVVVVWGAIPFVAITLHAALLQLPRDLVEAAEVDGAGTLGTFWHVVMPVLRPVLVIVATLSTIWDFQVFNQVWVMLNQRPSADYFLLGIYTFSESFRITQYGRGAALAVIMVLLLLVATSVYIRYYVRQVMAPEAA